MNPVLPLAHSTTLVTPDTMSRQYSVWGQDTHVPHRTGPPVDQLQRFRLPPPDGLQPGAPSGPGPSHIYPHMPQAHQQLRRPIPNHESFHYAPINSTVSQPHPPSRLAYHNVDPNAGHRFPEYTGSHNPFTVPPSTSSDRAPAPRDQGPPQVPQDHLRLHSRPPPPRFDQETSHYSTAQHPQPRYPAVSPSMGLMQSTAKSTTSSSGSFTNPKEAGNRVANIPNLLGGDKAQAVEGMTFRLTMRQQPKAARACGSGERDRRNIDPPPIVQLHVEAPGLTKEEINKYLRYEAYVMNCWIYDETGTNDASHMPSEYRYQRRLTGSLVATPFYGRDENGKEGCFFPYSDLSVRTLGRYRLKFNLIMLDTTRPGQARHFPILTETFSDPFDVYTAKEFPGINESSRLVRTLREQGCIISIKKGNDKKKKAFTLEDVEDEDEDEGSSLHDKKKRRSDV